MGTLNLFYKNAQDQLRTREVTGIGAFSSETPVTPIAGTPRNLVAAARIPNTTILELFYADESNGDAPEPGVPSWRRLVTDAADRRSGQRRHDRGRRAGDELATCLLPQRRQ